jgi:hypothetical protein
MSDDGLCPRCGHQLNPHLGTVGWRDADGKEWVGGTVRCTQCDVDFGQDDSGHLVEATGVFAEDE